MEDEGRIVLAEISPKRQAVENMNETRLLATVESTISQSIQLAFQPFEHRLVELSTRSNEHEKQLTELKQITEENRKSLYELEQKNDKRQEQLREEIVEMQKQRQSAKAIPPAVSRASSPARSSFDKPASYDVIVGGRKDGESGEFARQLIDSWLQKADVAGLVKEVIVFGKRPSCAKLMLQVSGPEDVSKANQQALITALKETAWVSRGCHKKVWCSFDKPPGQRALGRLVAKLSAFVESKLSCPPRALEVAAWQQLRVYLDSHRVAGLMASLSDQPDSGDSIVHLADAGIEIWFNLAAVARALGKPEIEIKHAWSSYSC